MGQRIFFVLTLLAGLAAFCAIPFIVSIGDTLAIIGQIGWIGAIIFCVNNVMMLAIPSLGWQLLLVEAGHRVSYFELLKANVMGFPLNFFTPSLYVGGEPVKAWYIAKKYNISQREVLATVIVNKFQEIGGLLLFIIAGTFIIVYSSDALTGGQEAALIAVLVVFVLIFAAVITAFIGNFKPVVRLCNLLIRLNIFKKALSKVLDKAAELEQMVRDAFVKKWKIFLISQFVTLLSAVTIFVRPAIFFYFFTGGQEFLSLEALSIFFVLTQLINIFQIIPGNLGLFEGGVIGFFGLIGKASAEASAFTILGRIPELALLIVGMWLIAHCGLSAMFKKSLEGKPAEPPANSGQNP